MPGYNPQQLAYSARNANSVTVTIGDQVVAFAQTTQHAYGFGTQALYGVGSAMPQEIQQLQVSPQISIDAFSLTKSGQALLAGGEDISVLLGNNQFDLHINDGLQNKVLFTYVGCVAQNFSQSIPANAPVSESISFLAMDVLDSSGVSILNAPTNAYSVPTQLGIAAVGQATGALGLL